MRNVIKSLAIGVAMTAAVVGSIAPALAGNHFVHGHGGNVSFHGNGFQGNGFHRVNHGIGLGHQQFNNHHGFNNGFGYHHNFRPVFHHGHHGFIGNGFNNGGFISQEQAQQAQQAQLAEVLAQREALLREQQRRNIFSNSTGNASNSVKTYSW